VSIPTFGAMLIWAGIAFFGVVVFFQVINLPVEFNASTRAKDELVTLGIVRPNELGEVKRVLDAAALTDVAATLIAVVQVLYLILRFAGGSRQ